MERRTNALHADFVNIGPFWMSVRQVTQAEWVEVSGENPSRFSEGFEAPLRPVESVSFPSAQEYCRLLTERLGDGQYRLPTEAEWEFAARCGTDSRWHFGESDRMLDDFAWHAGTAGARTRPCGTKQANPWGLFDLYGNVSEWTSSEGEGGRMIHRGGGWFHEADSCTSMNRLSSAKASDAIGIRLIWEAE